MNGVFIVLINILGIGIRGGSLPEPRFIECEYNTSVGYAINICECTVPYMIETQKSLKT